MTTAVQEVTVSLEDLQAYFEGDSNEAACDQLGNVLNSHFAEMVAETFSEYQWSFNYAAPMTEWSKFVAMYHTTGVGHSAKKCVAMRKLSLKKYPLSTLYFPY